MSILSLLGFLSSVAIVGAVVRDARQTARQSRQMENTRRVLFAVSARAHEIDVELSDLAAGVEAVGAATIELLQRDAKDFDRRPRRLPPLTPFEPSGGAPVSFEDVVVIWPGMTPNAELPASAAKLVHLEHWLREAVAASLPVPDRAGPAGQQNAALVAGRGKVLRAFVGLEDGSFVQFPAREVTADPRKRPWYRLGASEPGLHWTRPVVDATKRTLRISALLGLRSKGELVGVAGTDLRISSLAKQLNLDLPGFRRAYLVSQDGKIAVSDGLEAAVLPQVMDPDQAPDLPNVEPAALAERIAGADRGGYVISGERLVVFSKLISPPWTYVAEFEKSRYDEP
jgi:hypothetical protein